MVAWPTSSRDIDRRRIGATLREVVAHRERRAPVLADHQRRDALRHLRERIRFRLETVGRVIVRVDHAGCEHQAGGIDHSIVGTRRDGADLRVLDRPARRRGQRRHQDGGHAIDHAASVRLREVGERDHRGVVAPAGLVVARNVGLEALPRAAVTLDVASGNAIDFEAEPVRMLASAVERDRGEDLAPAFRVQHRTGADAAVPRDQILERQVQRAVGGGIHRRRYPLLVAQLAALEAIAGGAVGDDVGLVMIRAVVMPSGVNTLSRSTSP